MALTTGVPAYGVFMHANLMLAHIAYGCSFEVTVRAGGMATSSCSDILNTAEE